MKLVLAEFNTRVGNQVVWTSKQTEKSEIAGIEFQIIPSGLHQVISDTIYFTHNQSAGIAVYLTQSTKAQQGERSSMRVFSLAVLQPRLPFQLETWLRGLLEKYIIVNDVSVLENAGDSFADPTAHPILAFHDYTHFSGPLIYELWKAGLSRQRLILSAGSATDATSSLSVKKISQFCHLTGIIGSVPSDLLPLIPEQNRPSLEYHCLYNVSLLDTQRLRSLNSFCACTTDLLLTLPDRDVCDLVCDTDGLRKVDTTPVPSTWRDRHRFNLNEQNLFSPKNSSKHPVSYLLDRLAESTLQGLLWWASAGDTSLVSEPEQSVQLDRPELEGVALVGLFHNYTRQLFSVFAALAKEFDGDVHVGVDDMANMSLDPMSFQDRKFLEQFAHVWFNRSIHYRALFCSCLC